MSWRNNYTHFKIKKVEALEQKFDNNGEIEKMFDHFEDNYGQILEEIETTINQMTSIKQQIELLETLADSGTGAYNSRIEALDNKQGIIARNNNGLPANYQRDFAIGSLWLILED